MPRDLHHQVKFNVKRDQPFRVGLAIRKLDTSSSLLPQLSGHLLHLLQLTCPSCCPAGEYKKFSLNPFQTLLSEGPRAAQRFRRSPCVSRLQNFASTLQKVFTALSASAFSETSALSSRPHLRIRWVSFASCSNVVDVSIFVDPESIAYFVKLTRFLIRVQRLKCSLAVVNS